MTQKERQAKSRQMIREAAESEFSASGYEAFTVDQLCARHGISKGMLYHYYTGKDQLFLLCVEEAFQGLEAYLRVQMEDILREDVQRAVQRYFLAREYYFRENPRQKVVFETALFHPPRQLTEQIQTIHQPLDRLNHDFLQQTVSRLELRPGLGQEAVSRYFRGLEYVFMTFLAHYHGEENPMDVGTMVRTSSEMLDMLIFGIARREADHASLDT